MAIRDGTTQWHKFVAISIAAGIIVLGSQTVNAAEHAPTTRPDFRKNATTTRQNLQPIIINPTPIITRVWTRKKVVALTFDADMTYHTQQLLKQGVWKSLYEEQIIRELELRNIPATLFLTGLWVETYPDAMQEIGNNALFELANHSYSHPGFRPHCYTLPTITDTEDKEEILKTESLLEPYKNFKKFFRFPGMCYDRHDIAIAEELGYTIVHADAGGFDDYNTDANAIAHNVISRVKPGSIIVLHMQGGPSAPKTAEALPKIIDMLNVDGYRFLKLSELLGKKFWPAQY